MGKPWETYKDEIYRYYIEEGRPLAEVREILKSKYNFEACKRSYQNQIEVWGFKKNVRSADMRAYLEQKQQNIPDSEMALSQDIIDKITPRKVRRYEKRYAGKNSPSHDTNSSRDSRRPEDYDGNWDYDQGLFEYSGSYPVTPSHGSEDQFYAGDMLSNYSSYHDNRSYSQTTLGESLYVTTSDYSTMGSLTATDYGYARHSSDTHPRYSASPHPPSGVSQKTGSVELMKAALAGRYDEIRRLLSGGENPNIADRDGNTSLHYLVSGFHRLLDRAANSPGLLSGDRRVGTSEEFEEKISTFNLCLNLLFSHGAMITPNNKGETAAQIASTRLARYTDDPYNAAAGVHNQWSSFVNSLATTTGQYSR